MYLLYYPSSVLTICNAINALVQAILVHQQSQLLLRSEYTPYMHCTNYILFLNILIFYR